MSLVLFVTTLKVAPFTASFGESVQVDSGVTITLPNILALNRGVVEVIHRGSGAPSTIAADTGDTIRLGNSTTATKTILKGNVLLLRAVSLTEWIVV